MKKAASSLLLILAHAYVSCGQEHVIARLSMSETPPADLLASRCVVLYDRYLKKSDLEQLQSGFQKIGMDAIAYFDAEKVTAGRDPERSHAEYFKIREVGFLLFFRSAERKYELIATRFNGGDTFVDPGQTAWKIVHDDLDELLAKVYRDSWLIQKKQNFLINDIPEMDIEIRSITGRRSEFYPIDLKIDNMAVPRIADPVLQEQMEQLLSTVYPYGTKYKTVDVPPLEKDLRKQGFQYVLCFIHCRGKAARELLGYNMTMAESAYGSVTYPNGTPQVKTISAETSVYKFYIKHVESGNVFLGTKWDADESFIQALKNHILGFRAELKLN